MFYNCKVTIKHSCFLNYNYHNIVIWCFCASVDFMAHRRRTHRGSALLITPDLLKGSSLIRTLWNIPITSHETLWMGSGFFKMKYFMKVHSDICITIKRKMDSEINWLHLFQDSHLLALPLSNRKWDDFQAGRIRVHEAFQDSFTPSVLCLQELFPLQVKLSTQRMRELHCWEVPTKRENSRKFCMNLQRGILT